MLLLRSGDHLVLHCYELLQGVKGLKIVSFGATYLLNDSFARQFLLNIPRELPCASLYVPAQ